MFVAALEKLIRRCQTSRTAPNYDNVVRAITIHVTQFTIPHNFPQKPIPLMKVEYVI